MNTILEITRLSNRLPLSVKVGKVFLVQQVFFACEAQGDANRCYTKLQHDLAQSLLSQTEP